MKANYLLYPMILSDKDFVVISQEVKRLKLLNIDKMYELREKFNNVLYYLAKCVIELEEIVNNHNCSGYRYNSYLLNHSILTLSFIYQSFPDSNKNYFLPEREIIDTSIKNLYYILISAYSEKNVELE